MIKKLIKNAIDGLLHSEVRKKKKLRKQPKKEIEERIDLNEIPDKYVIPKDSQTQFKIKNKIEQVEKKTDKNEPESLDFFAYKLAWRAGALSNRQNNLSMARKRT